MATLDVDPRAVSPKEPDPEPKPDPVFLVVVVLVTDLIVVVTSSSPAHVAITTGAGLLGWLVRCWTDLRKRR